MRPVFMKKSRSFHEGELRENSYFRFFLNSPSIPVR